MLIQFGVVAGNSRRLNVAVIRMMTDHVLRMGGRFAREVPGVEFRERGVDVVGVEDDRRWIRFVVIDFGHRQRTRQ